MLFCTQKKIKSDLPQALAGFEDHMSRDMFNLALNPHLFPLADWELDLRTTSVLLFVFLK